MPVIVEPHYDITALETDLTRVYADFPGRDASQCIQTIRTALANGAVYYSGEFNNKSVAGALVDGPAENRRIQLVAVRTATRNRGVAIRLIDEIARLEQLTGAQMLCITASDAARPVLMRLGFVADPQQPERLRRSLP